MNIAYGVLLLIFGGLSLWLLTESHLKWYIKAACISTFCIFTIIFWSTVSSFLGWPANDEDIPDVVKMHWVVIKEPDKLTGSPGGIYVMIESAKKEEPGILSFFGYTSKLKEPRLFGLPYSRELHEQLQQRVIPKLKQGQPVYGSLKKKDGQNGKGKGKNKGKGDSKSKGSGSESQSQDWEFHELRPSDFLEKPEN